MYLTIKQFNNLLDNEKLEILVINDKEIKVNDQFLVFHGSITGMRVRKMVKVVEVLPNYASSDKVKYLNLTLESVHTHVKLVNPTPCHG